MWYMCGACVVVVWCGVVWCGVVCGVLWYGVVWYSACVVWYVVHVVHVVHVVYVVHVVHIVHVVHVVHMVHVVHVVHVVHLVPVVHVVHMVHVVHVVFVTDTCCLELSVLPSDTSVPTDTFLPSPDSSQHLITVIPPGHTLVQDDYKFHSTCVPCVLQSSV